MVRSTSLNLIIGSFMAALPGCVEDYGKIRETDMPRIAPDSRRIEADQLAPSAVERFNARALWEEYGGNVLQADVECKGKYFQVTGIVRCVASDDKDRPYIGFQVFDPVKAPASRLKAMGGKEKSWYRDGFPPLVLCYFEPGERHLLDSVKKEQTLQLTGRCLGRVKDPSGFKDYVVVLDSCRIAPE